MKAAYATFYLEGREDRLIKSDIDTEEIAKKVLADKGTIYELVHKAATTAAEPLRVDRKKRRWLADWEDEIKEAGGDGEEAYNHYLEGRIDELCARLDGEVLEDLAAISSNDGSEDGEEGEEDPEDEGDEDDEEDDEEEDDDKKEGDK